MALGVQARLLPVPHCLIARCGTCVADRAEEARLSGMDTVVERMADCLVRDGTNRKLLLRDKASQ